MTGCALIGQLSEDEILIVGLDAKFKFCPKCKSGFTKDEYVIVEDGFYENNKWVRQCMWNGDALYHFTLPPVGAFLKI